VAVAAGIQTLHLANAAVYERIDQVAATISDAVEQALTAEGVSVAVQRAGNLFSFAFGSPQDCGWRGRGPQNYAEVQAAEAWRYPRFFHAMLQAGVSLPPSAFESWFVSAAHDQQAVEQILAALPAAARAAAEAEARGRDRVSPELGRHSWAGVAGQARTPQSALGAPPALGCPWAGTNGVIAARSSRSNGPCPRKRCHSTAKINVAITSQISGPFDSGFHTESTPSTAM